MSEVKPVVEWLGGDRKDAEEVYRCLGLKGAWLFVTVKKGARNVDVCQGVRKPLGEIVHVGDFIHWDEDKNRWEVGEL